MFNYNDKSKTIVAGLSVYDGKLTTSGQEKGENFFRFYRPLPADVKASNAYKNGSESPGYRPGYQLVFDGQTHGTLKRFKDIVHEVGVGMVGYIVYGVCYALHCLAYLLKSLLLFSSPVNELCYVVSLKLQLHFLYFLYMLLNDWTVCVGVQWF